MVEDDIDIVLLFEKILISKGHNILGKAGDGEEAVKLVNELDQNPEIILMDHRMPRMSGLEATKIILQKYPLCKIIFISADLNIKGQALEAGAQSFLVKPVSITLMLNTINSL
ncbi:MAG: response regulator [Candidatus Hodarchaeales archaeon]